MPIKNSSATGYRGVLKTSAGRYSAYMSNRTTRKTEYLGVFNTPEEASEAYNKRAKEIINEAPKIENLPNEQWVDIVGYEGLFQISNFGRVKNIKYLYEDGREKLSKFSKKNKFGKIYLAVSLEKDGKDLKFMVQRLVFVGFIDKYLHPQAKILHIDGNTSNNKVSNLQIATTRMAVQNRKNKSGATGVEKTPVGRYFARIKNSITKKRETLGTFDTLEEASEIYQKRAKELQEEYDAIYSYGYKSLNNGTGFTGVYEAEKGRFQAIMYNSILKKMECLGTFDTSEEASEVFQKRKAEFVESKKIEMTVECLYCGRLFAKETNHKCHNPKTYRTKNFMWKNL